MQKLDDKWCKRCGVKISKLRKGTGTQYGQKQWEKRIRCSPSCIKKEDKKCERCGKEISKLRGNGKEYGQSQWNRMRYCSHKCAARSKPSRKSIVRFLEKIKKCDSGCWEWQGFCNERGYGQFAPWHGKLVRAHRFSYEHYKNKIPKGLTIDHLCRNRKCVNPDHLETCTIWENTLRGISPSAINYRKTHCKRGHSLRKGNVYLIQGKYGKNRHCKLCDKMRYEKRKMALQKML